MPFRISDTGSALIWDLGFGIWDLGFESGVSPASSAPGRRHWPSPPTSPASCLRGSGSRFEENVFPLYDGQGGYGGILLQQIGYMQLVHVHMFTLELLLMTQMIEKHYTLLNQILMDLTIMTRISMQRLLQQVALTLKALLEAVELSLMKEHQIQFMHQ